MARLKKTGIRYKYLGVLGKGDICQEERKKTLERILYEVESNIERKIKYQACIPSDKPICQR